MQNTTVLITIAICTFNRARLLEMTLTQMKRLQEPANCNWEVLVINNNSTDDTEVVVSKFSHALPIRYVFEANQGLSYARNRAIAEAKGEYIVWTDDDVLVEENWLIEYCYGFERHSDAVFFGGPIHPLLEGPPPRWLKTNFKIFEGAYACRNISDDEIELCSRSTFPFGANMAVRKDAYTNNLYNVELGRIGEGMLSDEETAIFEELVRRGKRGVWLPRAQVKHYIPLSRLTIQYLKRYFRGYGQTLIRGTDKSDGLGPSIFGVPRWMIRYLFKIYIKWLFSVILKNDESAENWLNLQIYIGKMIEYKK